MIYDHSLLGQLYDRSPLPLQHGLVSCYGLLRRWERLTPAFRRYRAELEQTQWWSGPELAALQEARLQALIRHAYEHVPYYRRVFAERRLTPADVRTPDDLYKLPLLTKQDVRRHSRALRADNVPRSRVTTGRTGGTTGTPLEFALDKERVAFDHAVTDRHWRWAGYRDGDRVALLRGFTLIPPDTRSGVYWRQDWVGQRLYLSGFHISGANLPQYVRKLLAWRPRFIAGYPSSLFALARFMEHEAVRIPVQAVFTSSEVLTPTERRVIEQRFVGQIWDRYGTGERLAVGQQCEHGAYHVNAEFGILHVDAPGGEPAPAGTRGEVIQTSLTNLSMPLIRYATGDVGQLVSARCPCGRGLPLMGPVDGRKDDVLVAADGRLMPRAGLDQIHEFARGVERCQLVQQRIGEVLLRVLPRPDFAEADVAELSRQLRRRLGRGTEIRVELVTELPLSATGKERFIVSQVDAERASGLRVGGDARPEQRAAAGRRPGLGEGG